MKSLYVYLYGLRAMKILNFIASLIFQLKNGEIFPFYLLCNCNPNTKSLITLINVKRNFRGTLKQDSVNRAASV